MESKECTKCKIEKPLEEYSLNKYNRPCSQCRECVRESNRKAYRKYKEARQGAIRVWDGNNKERLRETQLEYINKRREEDPMFKYRCNVRTLIYGSFKRACNGYYNKSTETIDMLGCDFEFFVSYISEQFEEGMTLNNHGEWHLDHDTPISSAKTEEDIIRLNHYTNFQPLWAEDNLRKSNKLDWEKD